MFPNSKIKDDIQKLKLKLSKDKPAVSMIEKDGPIADSPVAIDFEETHPGGSPQDVRITAFAFTIVLTFSLFPGLSRTFLI